MATHYESDPLTPDDYSLGRLDRLPLGEIFDDEVYTLRTRDPRLLRAAGAAGSFAADLTVTIVRVTNSPDKMELEFEPYSLVTNKALGIHKKIAGADGIIYNDPHTGSNGDDLGYLRQADASISVESGEIVERAPALVHLHALQAETPRLIAA